MMMAPRLLFVHNGNETFVRADHKLLAQRWVVHDWYQPTRAYHPVRLYQMVHASDLVFCWFASWHSFAPVLLARRLNKPAIVVVGGYDTASVPEAGYGSQRGGVRRLVSRTVMQRATHLIAFSASARREAINNVGAAATKVTVIYPGVEPLPMPREAKREQIALTIGGVWRENLLRKGLLPFVQCAALLPTWKFIHVGKWHDDSIDELRRAASPNVEFRNFVGASELAELCGRAAVYVQPSLHEGFGLSVAEAMSAGAIPVVTRAGSLPEVVGNCGVFIETAQPADIAAGLTEALAMPVQARSMARARIVANFGPARRAALLNQLVEQAVGGQ